MINVYAQGSELVRQYQADVDRYLEGRNRANQVPAQKLQILSTLQAMFQRVMAPAASVAVVSAPCRTCTPCSSC